MRLLEKFVLEYQEHYLKEEHFDDSLKGDVLRIRHRLLNETFLPSLPLKAVFDKLLRRCHYPMEVAIVGQFSAGKSTFLNALLSKDILPTGITPVTSKVNFINYDSEYKLKVSYLNGAHEYRPLEDIALFTDQRASIQEIKYLTLYAPMPLLKDISFVDTPGLNSQSLSDTQVTKKILRDVDGIIWLSLIDNAGKESETQILLEYLQNFKEKSLCVLNQKDAFSQDQIDMTQAYMEQNFSDFFSKVIPISAKQALQSRSNQQEILIQEALTELQARFKSSVSNHILAKDLEFFHKDFQAFQDKIRRIGSQDHSRDHELLESSNITKVLDFIKETIQPQAKESKTYTIKNELRSICEILVKEYETIRLVYESLEMILHTKETALLQAYDEIYLQHTKGLYLIYDKIDTLLQNIATTIYANIKPQSAKRLEEKKRLFWTRYIPHTYQRSTLDKEAIMEKLLYEDQWLDREIKSIIALFKEIELQSSEGIRELFRDLKGAIQAWQEPYELLKKHREIASDLEFANTRQYVAKVYEHTILAFHRGILGTIKAIHKQYAFFNGALSFSYKHHLQVSLSDIETKLNKLIQNYEKDPLKYTISIPSQERILEDLKNNFAFEKIELFLTSRRNYLLKIIQRAKAEYVQINQERIDAIKTDKRAVEEKITLIEEIKQSI